MSQKFKLIYFMGRARAEVARMIFAHARVQYEDVRISYEDWPNHKANTLNGQLPLLEVNGNTYCQSIAINRYLAKKYGLHPEDPEDQLRADMVVYTVNDLIQPVIVFSAEEDPERKAAAKKKYEEEQMPESLKSLEKMLISNKGGDGYFVGDKLTWADLMFFNWGTWPSSENYGVKVDLSIAPKLQALNERVKQQPDIAAWLKMRPESPF